MPKKLNLRALSERKACGEELIRRIIRRVKARVVGESPQLDYRQCLFQDLVGYLGGRRVRRALEIGPKDGADTRRLLTLEPERLVLVDLPRLEESNRVWLQQVNSPKIEYISGNLMYSKLVTMLEPFDLVWCTGVLYHNPEQLRMVRRLYDLLIPGGVLVLESATTRRQQFRRENCVEIIYPPSEEMKKKYHLSLNITHLPSARAISSWLSMVGFERITPSPCHTRVSMRLARARAAYLATKPLDPKPGTYYSFAGEDGYEIGNAL